MKDLIRNRWFVFLLGILIATVVLLGIGVILYGNGYRITYPQQFETSWDAVSGFASWVGILVSIASAIASFMAVWYAVRVADYQNRIALFEKRYECYTIIKNVVDVSDWVNYSSSYYHAYLGFYRVVRPFRGKMMDPSELASYYFDLKEQVMCSIFLFPSSDEKALRELFEKAIDLIHRTDLMNSDEYDKIMDDNFLKLKNDYCNDCNQFKRLHLGKMEQELRLK